MKSGISQLIVFYIDVFASVDLWKKGASVSVLKAEVLIFQRQVPP